MVGEWSVNHEVRLSRVCTDREDQYHKFLEVLLSALVEHEGGIASGD